MNPEDILAALDLPTAARVDRRVPKSLLAEHAGVTAADRRRILEDVEQLQWLAALKPGTVAVAAYRDELREYLEIAVLRLTLRAGGSGDRLLELLHRAVPYPVLAIAADGGRVSLSLAHKRASQAESGRTVLDGEPVTVEWTDADEPCREAFLAALALGRQPQLSMYALYQGWIDTLLALLAARRTGVFEMPGTADRRAARHAALEDCERLETEIARLRAAARGERQMARQVELNLELKRAEAMRTAALARL